MYVEGIKFYRKMSLKVKKVFLASQNGCKRLWLSDEGVLGSENEVELWNLSIPLSFVTQSLKSMQASRNHLQVID
jgi:hypothetical protein